MNEQHNFQPLTEPNIDPNIQQGPSGATTLRERWAELHATLSTAGAQAGGVLHEVHEYATDVQDRAATRFSDTIDSLRHSERLHSDKLARIRGLGHTALSHVKTAGRNTYHKTSDAYYGAYDVVDNAIDRLKHRSDNDQNDEQSSGHRKIILYAALGAVAAAGIAELVLSAKNGGQSNMFHSLASELLGSHASKSSNPSIVSHANEFPGLRPSANATPHPLEPGSAHGAMHLPFADPTKQTVVKHLTPRPRLVTHHHPLATTVPKPRTEIARTTSLRPGSTLWSTAKSILMQRGNHQPSNAQINSETHHLEAINHITDAQARFLRIGRVIKQR
jgi:hypothetical protein